MMTVKPNSNKIYYSVAEKEKDTENTKTITKNVLYRLEYTLNE